MRHRSIYRHLKKIKDSGYVCILLYIFLQNIILHESDINPIYFFMHNSLIQGKLISLQSGDIILIRDVFRIIFLLYK